jgi:hypothetical protein
MIVSICVSSPKEAKEGTATVAALGIFVWQTSLMQMNLWVSYFCEKNQKLDNPLPPRRIETVAYSATVIHRIKNISNIFFYFTK